MANQSTILSMLCESCEYIILFVSGKVQNLLFIMLNLEVCEKVVNETMGMMGCCLHFFQDLWTMIIVLVLKKMGLYFINFLTLNLLQINSNIPR